jgi:hypothetical protein
MNPAGLDRFSKRTIRYWYEDGLSETALGLIMLMIGLYQLVLGSGRIASGTLTVLRLAFAPAVIGFVWLTGRTLRKLKERFVYPRTGYVKYRREPVRNRLVRILVAAVPVSAFSAYAAVQRSAMSAVPAVVTIVFAAGLAYVTVKSGIMRFTAYGVFSILLALAFMAVGIDPDRSVGLIVSALGTVLTASGLVRFCLRFVRRRPSSPETETEADPGLDTDTDPETDFEPETGPEARNAPDTRKRGTGSGNRRGKAR